jgi:AraC-like DNA-binding protein
MGNKIKTLCKSVFLRYMLSYAVIMVVLFISISIYMNNYYSNTVREKIIDSNINTLSRIRYENEANMSSAINIGNQIGLSPYIVPFKFEEEPWKSVHLKEQIVPYTVTNEFFDKMFLVFDIDDYVFTSLTSINMDLFLEQIMQCEEVPPEELKQYIREHKGLKILKRQKVTSSLLDSGSEPMITFIVPIGGEQQSTGSLIFLVKENTYLDMFAQEIYEEHNTYIIYENQVMVDTLSFEIPDELVIEKSINNTSTLIDEIEYQGKEYLLLSLYGQQKNMQYVTVIPVNAILDNLKSAQVGFWVFLIGLSIPVIFLMLYLAQRNYKPISDIRHMLSEGNVSHDDFTVIKNGISNLVGKNVDLATRLEQSSSMRKSNFIKNFIKGRHTDKSECIEAAAKLKIDINKHYYIVSLVSASPEVEGAFVIEELAKIKGDNVDGYGVEVIALEQILFVWFSDKPQELDNWAERANELCRNKNEDSVVSVSAIHDNIKNAANAYLEASAAFDNRFIMGNAHVLRFEDVSYSAKNIVAYTRNYMDILKKAMHSGETDAVNKAIDDLFGYLAGMKVSLFTFRLIYNDIISIMLSDQAAYEDDEVNLLHIYDVFTLSSCRSIDDLDDMLRKLCHEVLQNKKLTKEDDHPIIHSIVEYLNENYSDANLNISAVADKYDISAARLSLDFKELMEMGPSEYLLLLRIEKSKELLSETDMSVKDICKAVGYYDTSGFIRRFRRYLAITPLQYRNNARRKKQ